jgi:hypothetical protein
MRRVSESIVEGADVSDPGAKKSHQFQACHDGETFAFETTRRQHPDPSTLLRIMAASHRQTGEMRLETLAIQRFFDQTKRGLSFWPRLVIKVIAACNVEK